MKSPAALGFSLKIGQSLKIALTTPNSKSAAFMGFVLIIVTNLQPTPFPNRLLLAQYANEKNIGKPSFYRNHKFHLCYEDLIQRPHQLCSLFNWTLGQLEADSRILLHHPRMRCYQAWAWTSRLGVCPSRAARGPGALAYVYEGPRTFLGKDHQQTRKRQGLAIWFKATGRGPRGGLIQNVTLCLPQSPLA